MRYFTIKDKSNHDKPIYQPIYRCPQSQEEILREEIKKLLMKNVIEPYISDNYNFPVILVKKKNGTCRLCVDLRKLNEVTIKDSFPLPRIQEMINNIKKGKKYKTTIDLKNGYLNITVDENSKKYLCFSTKFGTYRYKKVPFGFINSFQHFQLLIKQILNGLDFCQHYIDDIAVVSDTFEEHLEHIRITIDRLLEANIKINLEKT